MRAAVVERCGDQPATRVWPGPVAERGQALVRTVAAPITPLDVLCASGSSYFGEPATPYVPGVQGIGVVEQGERFPAGTRVWFPTAAGMAAAQGSLAEHVVVGEQDLVQLSGDVDEVLLAALGLSAVAAWCSLVRGRLSVGERVLVLGSSGVVGQAALQLARHLGAGQVFGAASRETARERAMALGADGFVRLRRGESADDLEERLRAEVGEVDLVVDPLCGAPATAALRCLSRGGRLVNLGSSAGPTASFASDHLRSGVRTILGYTNNDLTAEERASVLRDIERLAGEGELQVSHQEFRLEQVGDAWARQVRGELDGRAVITVR